MALEIVPHEKADHRDRDQNASQKEGEKGVGTAVSGIDFDCHDFCSRRTPGKNAREPLCVSKWNFPACPPSPDWPRLARMNLRLFEIIAALIVGAVALLVLKVIGLVIKFALIIALLLTFAAWLGFRAISRKFGGRAP